MVIDLLPSELLAAGWPFTIQWSLNVPPGLTQFLRHAHTVYLCLLCGSKNKQPLFPYTTLTDCFYSRDLTLYVPVVTICTTSLTFNNSTFCPHSVFMCFVWILEQTVIISLYNINWLVL